MLIVTSVIFSGDSGLTVLSEGGGVGVRVGGESVMDGGQTWTERGGGLHAEKS